MIIRTSVPPKKVENEKVKPAIVEEVKQEEFVPKKKNKKSNPAPIVDEASVVVEEEKVEEEIDLSEWLKEEENEN